MQTVSQLAWISTKLCIQIIQFSIQPKFCSLGWRHYPSINRCLLSYSASQNQTQLVQKFFFYDSLTCEHFRPCITSIHLTDITNVVCCHLSFPILSWRTERNDTYITYIHWYLVNTLCTNWLKYITQSFCHLHIWQWYLGHFPCRWYI
jgi:hypothetical protein